MRNSAKALLVGLALCASTALAQGAASSDRGAPDVTAGSTAATAGQRALVVTPHPSGSFNVTASAGTSAPGAETLVLNSAATLVPASALVGRKGITICNLNANTIFCSSSATPPAVSKGVPILQNICITFDFTDAVPMKCISATADQASSPATYSLEFK